MGRPNRLASVTLDGTVLPVVVLISDKDFGDGGDGFGDEGFGCPFACPGDSASLLLAGFIGTVDQVSRLICLDLLDGLLSTW
jgi:hypothetical protein